MERKTQRSRGEVVFVTLVAMLIGSPLLAEEFDGFRNPELIRQFASADYSVDNLELRRYALGMYSEYAQTCSVPEPVQLSAQRLRASVASITPSVESADGAEDARSYIATNGCDGPGMRMRLNLLRFINTNQEIPRSDFYAAQPPSLFNACMRDRLRASENRNERVSESDIRSWCACNERQIDRYVTPADREAFLRDYQAYYRKISDEREWRLLTRLNACVR